MNNMEYYKRFWSTSIFAALFSVVLPAHSEALLLTDIVASHQSGHEVSLLVKVTDRAPISNEFAGDIAVSLLPPGQCTAKATDQIGRNSPCYVVHLWENGSLVPLLRVRILDNVGLDGWVLLSYGSPRAGISRSVRIEMGNNGYYNDNSSQMYDLRVTDNPDFDPRNPYQFLFAQADRDLNILYRNRLRMYQERKLTSIANEFRNSERDWIADKEQDCGNAKDDEGYRCRWQRTLWRIADLAPGKTESN